MTEPLTHALHSRGARLTVAALPWVAPIYRCMPHVDDVLELPFQHRKLDWSTRRELGRTLRGCYDVAYVCPNSFKSALLPWLAKIPHRIGYVGEGRWALLNSRRPNPSRDHRTSMVEHYLGLLAHTTEPERGRQPQLCVPKGLQGTLLAKYSLIKHTYVALIPGAEYGPAKRWPAEHYAALAASVPNPIVLLGSGKEMDLCQAIVTQAAAQGKACLSLAGETSLIDAVHLIEGARVVVSNDSGLMHVAAALGRPQIAIFGSSSPLHTPPLNPKANVIWLKDDPDYNPPLECAPCFERECRYHHIRCLHDIKPSDVQVMLSKL